MSGVVRVNGQVARKASDTVREADSLALDAAEKFVSRGGHKLEHGLEHFGLEVSGVTAVDLGASTGGFTDCLLQRGATRVYAVDVGQGQLAWKLRSDPRVVVLEKTNARELRSGNLSAVSGQEEAAAIRLIVVDCSFISLRKILPAAVGLIQPGGHILALVKPQFEAGRGRHHGPGSACSRARGAGIVREGGAAGHRVAWRD